MDGGESGVKGQRSKFAALLQPPLFSNGNLSTALVLFYVDVQWYPFILLFIFRKLL